MKNTYHNLEGFKRKSLQMGSVLGIPIRDQFKDIVDAASVSQIHGKASKKECSKASSLSDQQKGAPPPDACAS
jgi:hypothetical protein